MPDSPGFTSQSTTRADIVVLDPEGLASRTTDEIRVRRRVPPGVITLVAIAFGTADVAAFPAIQSHTIALDEPTGGSVAQTGARAFRNTRSLSLREARQLALAALDAVEAARTAAWKEEARFLASLDE